MKRKMFKRFGIGANGGFTLVELIVVIAILAVLGGVGVPAYSGYVKKANIAADQQLINDVAHALQLYYYSNPDSEESGYVVLSQSVGPNAPGIAEQAMDAVFGVDNWTELKLKDSGWDAKAISEAANNPYAGSIPDSAYIVDIGTGKVLGDVQNCATSFSQFLKVYKDGDTVGAVDALKDHLGGGLVDGILTDAGFSSANGYEGISTDVLANATVFGVATNVTNNQNNIINGFTSGSILRNNISTDSDLIEVANWYAAGEALVAALDDKECSDIFASIDMTGDVAAIVANMRNAYSAIEGKIGSDTSVADKYQAYFAAPEGGKSQAQLDGEAYVGVMSTVNNLQDDYTKDKTAMNNSMLFTDGAIKDRVDSFVTTTEIMKDLTEDDIALLQGLAGSAVVVLLNDEGKVRILANNR